jgi:hypothetical protein
LFIGRSILDSDQESGSEWKPTTLIVGTLNDSQRNYLEGSRKSFRIPLNPIDEVLVYSCLTKC